MIFNEFFKDILTFFSSDCYFRIHWRIYCPGCGGTRAFIALMQGQIIQSIKYNPITLLFLVDVLLMTALDMIKKNKKYSVAKCRKIINISMLVFILVFFLVRNFMLYGLGVDVLGDLTLF